MCNISEGVLEKSWNNALRVGEERGEKRGRKIGEERNSIKLISNLMKNAPLTFDQATALLGIPANEREEYRKFVENSV